MLGTVPALSYPSSWLLIDTYVYSLQNTKRAQSQAWLHSGRRCPALSSSSCKRSGGGPQEGRTRLCSTRRFDEQLTFVVRDIFVSRLEPPPKS